MRWRKAQLSGTGESFVLPKRWRDAEVLDGDSIPPCRRVMLFKFGSEKGFSYEYSAYIRAAVMASKLSYTLLADDTEWVYGSLREYFLPRQIHCQPPTDWFLQDAAVPLGSKRWANADRVWFSTDLIDKADDWIREEMIDQTAMKELRQRQFRDILPQGETLPPELEDVFRDFAAATRELWRPNDQLATLIRSQRMELGLGGGGLRRKNHSPTWGGARRSGSDSQRPNVEDVPEDELDFEEVGGAERSDRGPIIAAYVRLGERDVRWTKDMEEVGVRGQTYGNLSLILDGANDAVRRLSKSSRAEPSYSRTNPTLFPAGVQPTLLVMSAEAVVVPSLESRSDISDVFKIQRTSPPSTETLRPWSDLLDLELSGAELSRKKDSPGSILFKFNQKLFNSLPRSLRVHLTRYFLRDLTTLALHADAFLLTGSSNVGRLACLVAGDSAVVGPRDFATGHGLGGRVRSLDGPWYPTSKASALFADE
ncbi:hypothetical protein T439DRAFT_286646 [Meredithblackwellia eburnea MCA 4105]